MLEELIYYFAHDTASVRNLNFFASQYRNVRINKEATHSVSSLLFINAYARVHRINYGRLFVTDLNFTNKISFNCSDLL